MPSDLFLERDACVLFSRFLPLSEGHECVVAGPASLLLIGSDGYLRTLIISASHGLEHYGMIYSGASQPAVKGSTIENEERELAAGN